MSTLIDTIHALCKTRIQTLLALPSVDIPFKTMVNHEASMLMVHLTVGFPIQPWHTLLLNQLTSDLQGKFPDHAIELTLDQFIKAHRSQLPGKGIRNIKNTIAIASGKGGVGKSTVAVNLAIALAQAGARVGILDADIYGPSIPLMLGSVKPVAIEGEHYLPIETHGIQAMSIGYLTKDDPALIWRGPMLAKSFVQMLDITHWDNLDYLLIDLPPGTGDIQLTLVQKIPLTGAVVVTTPQTVATLDAEKALKMFDKTAINVLGIIENMSMHHCSHCGHQDPIFGQGGAASLSKAHETPLLGQLPLDPQIGLDCDAGNPTAAQTNHPLYLQWLNIALKLSLEIANKPLNFADKFPPIIME